MVMPGDPPISDPAQERDAEETAALSFGTRPPQLQPVHLGDGVYASFDGYHVNLAVNDHRHHAVALDPDVVRRLIHYAQRCGVA